MRGWLAIFLVGISLAISPHGAGSNLNAQVEPTLTVLAGWGPPTAVVEEFFPAHLTVAEGTRVTWLQDTLREHTVTFLAGEPMLSENIRQPDNPDGPMMRNPLAEFPTPPTGPWDGSTFINSGRMFQGETFSVVFSKAGTYPFVCIPHAQRDGMVGEVTVVPAGTAGITTQADVDRYIASQAQLFERQRAEILAQRSEPGNVENSDGTTTWFVRNGTDQRSESDFRRGRLTLRTYLPSQLTIRSGDTVVWYTDTRVPVHTITFPAQGQLPPARWTPRDVDGSEVPFELLTDHGAYRGAPRSLGWPRILENPELTLPVRPSPVYDPAKLFSSGEMGDNRNGRAWALRFETPGTFSYFCLPHGYLGQIGEITVLPE